MIIASINQPAFGDSIWLDFSKNSDTDFKVYKKEDIVVIEDSNDKLIGLNLLNWSNKLNINKNSGFIPISSDEIELISQKLPEFKDFLISELKRPYFVVGVIKEIKEHPKLQKLKIIKVEIGQKELLQLVSGSINLKVGLKTVVAQTGAIMPNGSKILASKIGGIESPGALCNRADLNLSSPEIKGAIEIDDSSIQPGSDYASVENIIY
ncbi:YtpR family tRNA-binding protein [Xylocopilactobacillus apis]|uniref:tRNA-binding protein n=1 Tax=Xylocopilactobacillus apis TaxID=2932183 RepID=A0AAU9CYU2_9LACO|nr:hypothetical protein [Xylocopilactobacillus apis]BDR56398.1 tRNA-binding protein [Xylocopilactobacillus apis]